MIFLVVDYSCWLVLNRSDVLVDAFGIEKNIACWLLLDIRLVRTWKVLFPALF